MNINTYLLDLGERAAKSAAQGALVGIGYTGNLAAFSIAHVNWESVGYFAAGSAILSILTSVASAAVGSNGTASLVPSITQKGTTVAPVAQDGTTEYETYEGNAQVVAAVQKAEESASIPAPSTDPSTPPAVVADEPTEAPETVSESVVDNGDGTVTINGIKYQQSPAE